MPLNRATRAESYDQLFPERLPRKSYPKLTPLRFVGTGTSRYVRFLQRLYSMFPTGGAGVGLLILRLCAAGMLLRNAMLRSTSVLPFWEVAGLILLAALLSIGVFTPVSCVGSALIVIISCVDDPNLFDVASSLCVTSAVLLLGPGAFSVDARRFGRRRILPSGQHDDPSS